MADVHRRLVEQDFLRGLDDAAFALAGAAILGDVNYVHPFREGNGRTPLLYFEQLAKQAGHPIELRGLDRDRWIEASRTAHEGDYGRMAGAISDALVAER